MSDYHPPRFPLLMREFASFAMMRSLARMGPLVELEIAADKQLVLVVPGFMASDNTTARLRRSLQHAGHIAYGWGLGRNRGVTADILDKVDARVTAIKAESGINAPVVIVGWSLGGLVAREYAKRVPEQVGRVITLGSPFSGDIRGNNAWRIYELIARHRVDNPPIDTILKEKPPVPTIAFWSRGDGVVSPASARGETGEADLQVELDCTHMAFVSKPSAISAIASAVEFQGSIAVPASRNITRLAHSAR